MRASVGQGDPALLMRTAGGAFDVLVDGGALCWGNYGAALEDALRPR